MYHQNGVHWLNMKGKSTMRKPSKIPLMLHLTEETMSNTSTSSSVDRRGWEAPENWCRIYVPQSFKHQMCMIQLQNWSSKFNFIALCCWVRYLNSGHKSESLGAMGWNVVYFLLCHWKKKHVSVFRIISTRFFSVEGYSVLCWLPRGLQVCRQSDYERHTHLKFLSADLGVSTDGLMDTDESKCIWLLHEVHGGRLRHGSTTCWNYEI